MTGHVWRNCISLLVGRRGQVTGYRFPSNQPVACRLSPFLRSLALHMYAGQSDSATYAISQKQAEKCPVSAAAATRLNRVPFWPRSEARVKGFVGGLRHSYPFATRSQLNAVLAQKLSCEKLPFLLCYLRENERLSKLVSPLTPQSRSRSRVAFFDKAQVARPSAQG